MRRGTTPTHIFETIGISLVDATEIFVTYQQPDQVPIGCKCDDYHVVVEKTIEDITVEEDKITLELTQEETLSFLEDVPVKVQIRAKFPDGKAVACQVMNVGAEEILKEGVI